MKTKTLVLIFLVVVIAEASIVIYQYEEQMHVNDRVLQQFMNFIVSNHPSYFDQRYVDLANWEAYVPGYSRTVNNSGIPGAEMQIWYNTNLNYFGHLEANTTHGLFIWDGVLWVSNDTVNELIYTITG